jgi:[ribosomal protein S5]-alanine N-acetyltransferase
MKNLDALETNRLTGRRIQPDDFDLLCLLLQNPQVAATLGGVRSDEEVHQFLVKNLEQWNRHGIGRWIWHYKANGRFVGRGGLHHVEIEDREEVEIGYALLPEHWNQGLATEIAQASIDVAFNGLGAAEVVAFTLPTNRASRRVMEKCGLTLERDIVWQDLPHVLYRLRR